MSGPLEGVRVVTLAGMGPVPFAGMLLADMGAHVVRVARPANRASRALSQTDGLREEHDLGNRGVDTVAVDLKDPGGVESVLRLAEAADVFVEGYRPGVAERLGLGPEVVTKRNPTVVYARLTGYGQDGPLARTAGHDINYVAQSGALHAMAREGEAPRPPLNLLGDYAGGGTMAAFGIVCAVLEARASGHGQVLDAAMIDGVALLTAKIQGLRAAGLYDDVPGTNYLDSGAPFYDTYRCKDGGYVAVGALEPDFYREFVSRLGVDVSGWPDQEDRSGWPRLRELIGRALASRTRAEWAEVYAGTDACVTPVLTFDEAAGDPHNAGRRMFQHVGDALHPAPAPRFSRTPGRRPSAPSAERLDVRQVIRYWNPGRS
ncbi:CaiB/BaiF CoA transferase family protein [Streptomyces cinereoruber]|uniref:CoA transferase n=1 Tax=Streptomyces cinereoruber TaxID=67260 RepID=A0ABX6BLQ8_9ACTN|nr:CaiB/BaiF CoA-transferase family protein [Streptomyces cinereoruber]MBB4158254.1 alpha-methylacyl-CoA racemase [Streptomyces cinereoruber]MBY8819212.1 CoA transferase [Streptomyces cinereoruber]NIH63387.1 alpha-methylacyl-CoA racemase [Streptomyces cinereoruber]QEV36044.1 CoA transferase [Streptomyces cinereoruber]